ncbi:MAG: hypothetical protein EXR07_19305 [Acetobacteraceae bacterium]|nr:hypothetical protein [Acetobacteraceae bacterium]
MPDTADGDFQKAHRRAIVEYSSEDWSILSIPERTRAIYKHLREIDAERQLGIFKEDQVGATDLTSVSVVYSSVRANGGPRDIMDSGLWVKSSDLDYQLFP